MPGSTSTPLHIVGRTASGDLVVRRPDPEPAADRPLTPVSPNFSQTALTAMHVEPHWQGTVALNDILFTLCLLDHDLRILTLERIADVVAAGLKLQHEKEEAEFSRATARRQRRAAAA